MYVSLYRKYRPQTFSEMVGQSAAVSVLRESLKEQRLGHAYLFSGPRGCGKTSAARLVAKTLNCSALTETGESCGVCSNCVSITMGEHLDVIEIDGASNRGIGEIRDLKSHVNLKPLSSKFKVYIIDEVHMLTEAAFNALLKTLEEPPGNVVFLLATTEPHKVPVTIRSRCQHIPFHRIAISDMVARLSHVAAQEKIESETEAVWEISRQADGALRDALSLLEQAVTLGRGSLTLESVSSLMGGSNRTELEKWVIKLRTSPEAAAADLDKMLARGISVERLTESFFVIFRDIWLYLLWGERSVEALENSESELAFLRDESKNWDVAKPKSICGFFGRLLPRTRYGMRLEVFSGMVMLELMRIIEGEEVSSVVQKAPSQTAARNPQVRTSQEKPPVSVKEPELPAWDDDFSDLLAEQKLNTKVPMVRPMSELEPVAALEINFAESLGNNDFAKLLTAIGSKAIVFGAALLRAELREENGDWQLIFPTKSTPAENFLNLPQNKRVLADAIYKVWSVGKPQKKEADGEAVPLFPNEPPAMKNARIPADGKTPKKTKSGKDAQPEGVDTDMMLKLMGANLLYARNLEDDDSAGEKTE